MARETRIASLDGLRGLAASAVVYAHVKFFYPSTSPWIDVTVGDEAVALFFSLSGFLMAMLYGDRRFEAWDYLVHRFARIYPVYLASVMIVALLTIAFPGSYLYPIEGVEQIARHVLLFGSTGVFWSIPPEIQFYLFFLLVWLWFSDPTRYQWVAVGTAAFLIVAGYFGFPGPGILLTSKLPYFLFGCLAGRLFTRRKAHPDSVISGVAALALLLFFFLVRGFLPTTASFWGVGSALTAAIIVYLAACGSPVSAFVLASRPLTFVGRISFSLYLFHLPVMFVAMRTLGKLLPLEVAVVLCIAIAYLVAWLTYRLIESPARRYLIDHWRSRHRDRLPVAAE